MQTVYKKKDKKLGPVLIWFKLSLTDLKAAKGTGPVELIFAGPVSKAPKGARKEHGTTVTLRQLHQRRAQNRERFHHSMAQRFLRPCKVINRSHMAEIPKEATKFKGATREKVRRALARVLEEDAVRLSTKAVSIARVRGAGGGDQNAITELVRLWRAGHLSVSDSWDDAPVQAAPAGPAGQSRGQAADGRVNLMERIRAATTDGDREAIVQEVGALVAGGVLAPDEAAQIKGALGEARLAAEARRLNEPPPEDPTKMLLASPEALEAARAIDWLVDDGRRDQVLGYVAAQLELDRAEHPNADEGGGA